MEGNGAIFSNEPGFRQLTFLKRKPLACARELIDDCSIAHTMAPYAVSIAAASIGQWQVNAHARLFKASMQALRVVVEDAVSLRINEQFPCFHGSKLTRGALNGSEGPIGIVFIRYLSFGFLR